MKLALAFLFFPVFAFCQDAGAIAARIRAIEDRWKPAQSMARLHVPGVSIALIHDSKVEWVKPYGMKFAKGSKITDRVDVATLFQAASISKPVAALAAMHVAQFGAFDLDQDVNAKLKSWKVPDNAFTAESKVTLRGILSHSAGLSVHGFAGYAAKAPVPNLIQVLNGENPANSPPIVVEAVPGSKWSYSGGGYTILQLLLQEHFNKPFAEIMDMLVLGRIGMRDSTYAQPLPRQLHYRAAQAHDSSGHRIKGVWHTYPEQAAAGLWTTPSDLARFLIEIQKAARGESNKIIEKNTAIQMLTLQKGKWGLGFELSPDGGFGHGGSNAGYKCYMHANAHDGLIIMTNGDRGSELIKEIVAAVEAEYGWQNFLP